jgi:selenocysteine lyase/cysteine desulfurase
MIDQSSDGAPLGEAPTGSLRSLFSMPDDVAYFNTAAMAPLLRSVREAGEFALARSATPWEIETHDWFDDAERLRRGVADLLGVSDGTISFVPACSYGLAVAAHNLSAQAGDQVLVLAEEFPSNYYTWRRFCERTGADLVPVPLEPQLGWTGSVLDQIGERTRVIAVPHVHWTNGAALDLVAVSDAAREAGAALVIDASQSLGAMPLDIERVRPDFLVAVGYKWLLGTLGLAYLYVADEHLDGQPLEENWINRAHSEEFSSLVDYNNEYRTGARRFDMGERSSFNLMPMAVAAIDQLNDWGVPNIAAALRVVTDEISRRTAELGLTVPASTDHGPHMLGVDVPRETAVRLGEELAKRQVIASVRGRSLRLAPHLHITGDDIDRLIDGIAASL